MNATGYPANIGGNPPGTSEFRNDIRPTLLPGMRAPRTMQCRDGWVVIGTYQPGIGERTLDGMLRWAGDEGAASTDITQRGWTTYMNDLVTRDTCRVDDFNRGYDAIADIRRDTNQTRTARRRARTQVAARADSRRQPTYAPIRSSPRATTGPWSVATRTPAPLPACRPRRLRWKHRRRDSAPISADRSTAPRRTLHARPRKTSGSTGLRGPAKSPTSRGSASARSSARRWPTTAQR